MDSMTMNIIVCAVAVLIILATILISANIVSKTKEACQKKCRKLSDENKKLNMRMADYAKRMNWLLGNEHEIFRKEAEYAELIDKIHMLEEELAKLNREKEFWKVRASANEQAYRSVLKEYDKIQKELTELQEKYKKAQELYPDMESKVSNATDAESEEIEVTT